MLGSGKSVTLYTGKGTDTEKNLYWKSAGKGCKAIWNNEKDTLYLKDSSGKLVLYFSYGK